MAASARINKEAAKYRKYRNGNGEMAAWQRNGIMAISSAKYQKKNNRNKSNERKAKIISMNNGGESGVMK
jgi:hypothetical protein